MDKLVGKICYTLNAKTNTVDTWRCVGVLPGRDELFYELRDGKKSAVLPKRCVYSTIREALDVAKKK